MADNDCARSSTGAAQIPLSARILIASLTLAAFNVEWWFFELLRTPYRPPEDMTTLLGGAEIKAVIVFMVTSILVWLTLVIWFLWQFKLTRIDVIEFAALCGLLSIAAVLIVRFPAWPVTPLELFRM